MNSIEYSDIVKYDSKWPNSLFNFKKNYLSSFSSQNELKLEKTKDNDFSRMVSRMR